jgi:hypothetical protein
LRRKRVKGKAGLKKFYFDFFAIILMALNLAWAAAFCVWKK